MKPEHIEVTRRAIMLAGLSEQVQGEILAGAREKNFERGSTIFLQGEDATAFYIVVEGWVKLYRIAPSGAEAVVGVFTRGRSFGEAVALRNSIYPVSAEAVTDCTLVRIDAAVILRVLREDPQVAVTIIAAAFSHLQSLVAQVESLKAQTGAQRVAEFLLELAQCETGTCQVTLPYDKVLIAGHLGMKPESLSRAFAKLREHGVRVRHNQANIENIETLREYAAEDPANAWSRP